METKVRLKTGAAFSNCQKYRYSLWRIWDESRGFVLFVCLNPSTADETNNDPTVRRCIQYAKDWGYGGMYMSNIFAYRTKSPSIMKEVNDPVGLYNDWYLKTLNNNAEITVCAWGVHGNYRDRENEVLSFLKDPHCLITTKNGHPGHPLYLRTDLKPILFKEGKRNGCKKESE
jgi:hypothetical protein